ncbi:MAG: hypothetical protein AAF968_12755 [Pseudomonadota bacterium]
MIDPIEGLGQPGGTDFIDRFSAIDQVGTGVPQAADVAQFEASMAVDPTERVAQVASIELAAGPAEAPLGVQVANGDPWIASPPAAVAEPGSTMSDRLFDGVTDVREAVQTLGSGPTNPGDMTSIMQFSVAMMHANVALHVATNEVSGFVSKLDGLLKSG